MPVTSHVAPPLPLVRRVLAGVVGVVVEVAVNVLLFGASIVVVGFALGALLVAGGAEPGIAVFPAVVVAVVIWGELDARLATYRASPASVLRFAGAMTAGAGAAFLVLTALHVDPATALLAATAAAVGGRWVVESQFYTRDGDGADLAGALADRFVARLITGGTAFRARHRR